MSSTHGAAADSGSTSLPGLAEIADVGVDRIRGGYSRHLFDDADRTLRDWFTERASRLGLDVERDRNGNLWAWWGEPGPNAFVTGSHLDSVPGGGAFDGPLGIVSALEALGRLRDAGHRPARPVAVVAFAEEEGSRFGVACLGSRLLTGALHPDRARALRDEAGRSLAQVYADAGLDPAAIGPDPARLDMIGTFVELHVEQGRGLVDLDEPVALAASILGHGRWRIRFRGQGNHAGATPMQSRQDPMVAAAATIARIPDLALAVEGSRATVGRVSALPGGTNVIPSVVDCWLDARAATDDATNALLQSIRAAARDAAAVNACSVEITEESWSPTVRFPDDTRAAIGAHIAPRGQSVPALPSGAGHDAGILAAHIPSAMLFVRNPTGVSHAPEEFATADDCAAGIAALERVIRGET
ncbi:allantoate amidohydrolase [Curtobacterium ammoniigenes]|uniref:allantoate amidohydrolase n=1 Tax=Curtobacterium ammoniigenes TaxID=395387 RepID=UPI00082CD426|nr:allantoate amidohydrolase [Curtobacterium ammoniigenes]